MIANNYYSQEVHGPYELYDIGNLNLEEGGTIRGCKLAYVTLGTLNTGKNNAVLVPTWYSGTSKIMEQVYTGKGRTLDPEKYFIMIVNQIGSGLSSSPHNTPAPAGMGNFPNVRIGDDVRAQHKLITEKFGIESLALVFGGSMGAQQTYEWAVRYPDMVKRAAVVAGTAKNTEHDTVRGDPGRCHHVGPWIQRRFLRFIRKRARRFVAPRQDVGGDGVEHRLLQAEPPSRSGFLVDG